MFLNYQIRNINKIKFKIHFLIELNKLKNKSLEEIILEIKQ